MGFNPIEEFQHILHFISSKTILLPNILPLKIIKKPMNNLFSGEIRLKCKERYFAIACEN